MLACVCCARTCWYEDLSKRHLAGPHADWLGPPEKAWQLLSVEEYSIRAPLIPRLDLGAAVEMLCCDLVQLHKRRCHGRALAGQVPVPWCQAWSSCLS